MPWGKGSLLLRQLAKSFVPPLLALLLTVWTASIVTRVPVLSHFHQIAGDTLDGMLALAIEMHWWHVLNGTALGWRTTDYFFPIGDTLGYNESFFLHGTCLALLRSLGVDIFLGLQLVDWCFRVVGFVSMWALARRCFDWPRLINVLAATLFVTANCYYPNVAVHAQFLACNWLPLIILVQIESFRAAARGTLWCFIVLASIFAVLTGALLITSYYVSFFFILADATVLVLLFVFYQVRPFRFERLVHHWGPFAAVQLAILAICCIPFLMIYLPKAAETGMHPLSDFIYSPRPIDVINVGPHNLLWSRFYQLVFGRWFPRWEGARPNQTGATPVLFMLFLISGFRLIRTRSCGLPQTILFAMWCSNLLLLAVVIRWGSSVWPWAWIYRFIPGAAGVRVISLIQLVLSIPTILVACDFIATGWRQTQTRPVFVLLALLLLIEQINDYPVFNIDRPAENAFFTAIDHVPSACHAFFAINSRPGPDLDTLYRHNVDAMIIAELSGIPTINGYASFLPPRWRLVHPEDKEYETEVHEWLTNHAVTGPICAVDFKTGTWTVLSDGSYLPAP
jgi:hypothetical protein